MFEEPVAVYAAPHDDFDEPGLADRRSGSVRRQHAEWRQQRDGTSDLEFDQDQTMVLDSAGAPVVSGTLVDDDRVNDYAVMKLSAADGSALGAEGKRLLVKDPGDPTQRFVTFLLKDETLQSPTPGSAQAPPNRRCNGDD